jgi:hypothetical protein
MGEAAFVISDPGAVAASTEIVEYNPITAALDELRNKYKDVAYDVSTTAGLKQATQARAEIRGYRVALENKRKEIKAPALERCKAIDTVAKDITQQLLDLETPIDQQIKAEEKRKEEERAARAMAEAEHRAKIMQEIGRIQSLKNINGKTSQEIMAEAERVNSLPLDKEFFGEFYSVAIEARTSAFGHLMAHHHTVKAQEEEQSRIAAERAELAKLRAEQEAREAEIAKLRAEQDAQRKVEEERLRKEREAEETRLKAAREAEEAKLKAEREAEAARLKSERQAEEAKLAEIRKQQEEEARKQAEAARIQAKEQARIETEKLKIEAEKKRQAEQAERLKERKKRLAALAYEGEAKHFQALQRIGELAEDVDGHPDHEAVRNEIALICEANL